MRKPYIRKNRPTLGLLLDWLDWMYSGFQVALWRSVAEYCRQQDVNLVCFVGGTISDQEAFEFREVSDFRQNVLYDLAGVENVDGVIVPATIGTHSPRGAMTDLCQRYQPLPVVTVAVALPGIPAVLTDNYQSMQRLVTHLIDVHGYRRIGFYRKAHGVQDTDERYRAYVETLLAHNIPVNPDLIVPGQYYDHVVEGLHLLFDERRLRPRHDLEALIAVDDFLAQRLLPVLQARRIRVPGDLAVTGFDDEEQAQLPFPPLTTVRQPIYEQGRRAVDLLLARLRGESTPEEVVLPGKLILRQSCGCRGPAIMQGNVLCVTDVQPAGVVTPDTTLDGKAQERLTKIKQTVAFLANEWLSAPAALRIAMLLEAFWHDTQRGMPEEFLPLLRASVSEGLLSQRNLPLWQETLSLLYQYLLPVLPDAEARSHAHVLLDQVREVLSKMQGVYVLEQEAYFRRVNAVNRRLATIFDVQELLQVLTQELPRLEIPGCYLSLYEDPANPTTWSRLILAYHDQKCIFLKPEGRRFPTAQLTPEGMLPQDRQYHLVIHTLHVQDEQLGLAVFEADSASRGIYPILADQISSALKGALLLQQHHKSEAYLRTLIDNLPLDFWTLDTDLRYTMQNALSRQHYGADVVGKTVDEIAVSEETKRLWRQDDQRALQGEIVHSEFETMMTGEPRIFEDLLAPVRVGRDIIGILGIAMDITDRKQAEARINQALTETQGLLEAAQAILGTPHIRTMCQQLLIYCHRLVPAAESYLFLVDHAQRRILAWMRGNNLDDPDWNTGPLNVDYDELEAGISGQVFRSKQSVLSVSADDGIEPPETIARRKDAGFGALIVLPLIARDEVIGTVTVVNHIDQRAFTPHDQKLLTALATQAVIAIENARLFDQAQQEIAERTRAEAELQRAKDVALEAQRVAEAARQAAEDAQRAAEMANQAKTEFLANMSHELRTPLNAILGYTQVLQQNAQVNAGRVAEDLRIIRKSGEHLLALINDLLDLARIEARKIELYPTVVPLPGFLTELVNIVRIRAVQKTLQLQYTPLTPLPALVMADEKRLRQVLLNLLNNAVKFTPSGTITFRVGCQRFNAENNPEASTANLRFEIEDTGIGIASEDVAKIFQAFEQAGTADFRASGTGLGLAISRKLIQMMGGDLSVRSQLGQGSTFWFDLNVPMAMPTAEKEPVSRQQVVGYHGPARKILVVDDQAANRGVMVALLHPLGFEVREAANGQDAIHLATTWAPDLILMDILMPGMTGVEAAQRIRHLPECTAHMMIAVSANIQQLEHEHQTSGLWNGFLSKPVDVEQLLRLLEHCLRIEWRYAESATPPITPPDVETIADEVLLPPSQQELADLDQLVRKGDLQSILQYATALEERDPQLLPFARKLAHLANTCQDEAILRLLAQFRSPEDL